MTESSLSLASGVLAFALAACTSGQSDLPPVLVQNQPDGSSPSLDAGTDDIVDASIDRSMTTRALLPTPANNLLLDPFVTSDESWGHFVAVVPAVDPAQTAADCPNITREFLSASPIGISAPVALVNQTVLPASTGCTALIAPFVGSSEPVGAQIWISLSDGSGNPAPIPDGTGGATGALAAFVSVGLLPNAVPAGSPPPASYPFTLAATPPVVIAGRTWALLELAAPVSIPDGGWFVIAMMDPAGGLYLAAPQIVPAGAMTLSAVRTLAPASRLATGLELGAILQYGRHHPRHPRLRPRRPRRPDGLVW